MFVLRNAWPVRGMLSVDCSVPDDIPFLLHVKVRVLGDNVLIFRFQYLIHLAHFFICVFCSFLDQTC